VELPKCETYFDSKNNVKLIKNKGESIDGIIVEISLKIKKQAPL